MRTGKFTRVRYLRICTLSLEIVKGLPDNEKALFLDQCFEWFRKLEEGQEIELVDTGNPFLNLALREEIAELQEGYEKYMQAVTSRKTADTIADAPPIAPPIHLSKIKPDKNNKQTREQIRAELVQLGYSSDEIDKACYSVQDWNGIQNPTGYIRKSIDNQRKAPKKILPAQNFQQRDYSGVDDELKAKLAAEMAEFKRNGGLQL